MLQLSPTQIQEDTAFWLFQDLEHNLFFVLGLDDPRFKAAAAGLHQAYGQALRRGDLRWGLAILQQSQQFKTALLEEMNRRGAGSMGSVFPAFVDHVKRELDAMLLRTSGRMLARDELCFINQIGAEHAAIAAHLLDPTEVQLQEQVRTGARQAGAIANACATHQYPTLRQLTLESATALDQVASSDALKQAKSIIHPVLLEHIKREQDRFLAEIPALPAEEAAGDQQIRAA